MSILKFVFNKHTLIELDQFVKTVLQSKLVK
jgi:hypothetical protein